MVYRMKMRRWENKARKGRKGRRRKDDDQKLKGKEPELRKQKKDEDEETINKAGLLGILLSGNRV